MISAPQPFVIHLFTIFRQIAAGELRIPAFQRDFIWRERQVIELLASVREHYPVGSILLWHVAQKMLEIASSQVSAFPLVTESYPTSYILDGMQRLSTLYGTFHFKSGDDEVFNVLYDLRRQKFYHADDLAPDQIEAAIPLAALIAPRRMLEYQARLADMPDGDRLLEELLATQGAFQDYMIPVVRIGGHDIDRIVGIFERINSTGTRLDTVDFMRAITWNQAFDLNRALDAAQEALGEDRLQVSDETIIKCVGLMLGVQPSREELLTLRTRTPFELSQAFAQFPPRLEAVAAFLRERLRIESSAYLPYEGQLLVLFKAIGMAEASKAELDLLARWFWAAGFNESLRGKPDHYVVRAVEGWRALIAGQIRGLEPRLRLSVADFFERRLIKGKALSGAFGAMFAVREARSLITGNVVPSSLYMSAADLDSFQTIFSTEVLRGSGINLGPSSRIFPNIILTNVLEREIPGPPDWEAHILRLAQAGQGDVLASQLIDDVAVAHLQVRNVDAFLKRRAELMREQALALVGS